MNRKRECSDDRSQTEAQTHTEVVFASCSFALVLGRKSSPSVGRERKYLMQDTLKPTPIEATASFASAGTRGLFSGDHSHRFWWHGPRTSKPSADSAPENSASLHRVLRLYSRLSLCEQDDELLLEQLQVRLRSYKGSKVLFYASVLPTVAALGFVYSLSNILGAMQRRIGN